MPEAPSRTDDLTNDELLQLRSRVEIGAGKPAIAVGDMVLLRLIDEVDRRRLDALLLAAETPDLVPRVREQTGATLLTIWQ